jgi:undecaprenyl-diphosphatase
MDLSLFFQINQYAGKWAALDGLAIFFARYFEYFLLFFLLLFLIKNFRKYWAMVLLALASAGVARFGVASLIRHFWHRNRPFIDSHVNLLFSYPNEASFPSGHATFYFALATVVFLRNKKAGILFYLAAFLICLGRIFVGIHWPSDILIGALVGIFSGWLIHEIFKKFLPKT